MPFQRSLLAILLTVISSCSAADRARDEATQEGDHKALGQSLRTFHEALVAENPAVIRKFLHAEEDLDQLLVEAQTKRMLANIRFLRAIPQAWNIPHGVNPFDEFHIFLSDDFLAMSDLEIEGDRAILPPGSWQGTDIKDVPPMKRIKHRWRIDLTPTAGAATPALAAAVSKYADVVERTAMEMNAGNLKSVGDVKRALEAAPKFQPTDDTPDLILSLPAKE